MIGFSNVGGVSFPGTFTLAVTDLTGVKGLLSIQVDQLFVVNPLVNFPGWTVTSNLVGMFSNVGGTAHGNQLFATGVVGLQPQRLTQLNAEDRNGLTFNLMATDFNVNAPDKIQLNLQYSFLGNPVAGDTFFIPFTLDLIAPAAIPEPNTFALSIIGILVLLGWRQARSYLTNRPIRETRRSSAAS
jgi:hypothetical protein